MVGGQMDDLAAETDGGDLEQLETIHRRKTGAILTVSLRLGALTAQASSEQLDRLTAYGSRLGLAFQIVDDLLDRSGKIEAIGKLPGQDTQRGKLTYPALLGEGASRRRAEMLIEQAIDELAIFGERSDQLAALARYVLERNR
jgi:geranylgeranyl diphosphate synthase type II